MGFAVPGPFDRGLKYRDIILLLFIKVNDLKEIVMDIFVYRHILRGRPLLNGVPRNVLYFDIY